MHDEGDTPGSWSPDGRSVTFDRNFDGDHSIWVVALRGASRRLTPDGYYGPDWSPDGQLIAYGGAEFSRPGIWVIDPNNGRKRRLTGSSLDGAPLWSHDGRRLAFIRGDAVWIMNADGSGQRRLVSSEGSEETGELRWSPDDRMLAFTRRQGDRDIFVVTAAGNRLRNLTANSRLRDSCPSWSPDGRTIAFSSDRSGSTEIYLMNRDGGSQRRLGQITTANACPVWSPKP
jgi:TolB protein